MILLLTSKQEQVSSLLHASCFMVTAYSQACTSFRKSSNLQETVQKAFNYVIHILHALFKYDLGVKAVHGGVIGLCQPLYGQVDTTIATH